MYKSVQTFRKFEVTVINYENKFEISYVLFGVVTLTYTIGRLSALFIFGVTHLL